MNVQNLASHRIKPECAAGILFSQGAKFLVPVDLEVKKPESQKSERQDNKRCQEPQSFLLLVH